MALAACRPRHFLRVGDDVVDCVVASAPILSAVASRLCVLSVALQFHSHASAADDPIASHALSFVSFDTLQVLWCNMLLIRLFAAAQQKVSMSLARRCPITTQVTWVALQVGCVTGTGLSFLQPLIARA